jgi:hypothetical protein
LRVIDYKLGRAPKFARPAGLRPARSRTPARRGRSWPLASAGYVAFEKKNAFIGSVGRSISSALREGRHGFDAVARIGRGQEPTGSERAVDCTRRGFPRLPERTTSAIATGSRLRSPLFDATPRRLLSISLTSASNTANAF